MTLSVLDTDSAVLQVMLVTFSWGTTPTVARYCRGNRPVVLGGETFLPEPLLGIDFSAFQGGTEDVPIFITMPGARAPYTRLSMPFLHTKVMVRVEMASPGDPDSRYEVFTGRVSKVTVKPSGVPGLVKGKIVGVKARLNGTLGVVASTTCLNQFGDENQSFCGIVLDEIRVPGTITAVYDGGVPNRITVSFPTAPDLANIRWNRGYAEVDGLRLMIRQSLLDGRFELKFIPPPYWAGSPVTLTPGCDKNLATCRYWQRESQFLAIGYAMSGRNPLFEE